MQHVRQLHQGNVATRFGRSLEAYAEAVYVGDLEAASNALIIARGDISVFMTEPQKADYRKLPGYAEGDSRNRAQVLTDMEEQRAFLLRIARKANVYAKEAEEDGDGSSLDQEIPEAA